ncbi:MAG TPA: alpha-xylosidase [Abditibacterium sp.]|jgi:alpha-D-xyloside xylohydrolase
MKFTDGNWMMQPGVRAFYPAQAYDVQTSLDALTIYATKQVKHRGDTLDGPLLTVNISSPLPDVIGVKITHYAGEQDHGVHFPLSSGTHEIRIENGETEASLKSGNLSVHISRESFGLEFRGDGKTITKSADRHMALMTVADGSQFVQDQLDLSVGECVYGLGERFTSLVKNGQVIEIWNKDGGTGSDQAYKNVPFYLTNRGYGVFVNHAGPVSFEVASEKVSRVGFSVSGQELEYFVIYGPTPKEILQKYTALTGRPALPPAWTFGLWLTTSFTTSYDEETVTSFIEGMASRDLPLSVIHFDCFWMREFQWCDFEWDTRVFPDPKAMLERFKARGLKVCVWINPYIAQKSPLFEEGKRGGFLLKKPNGDVWQTDQWQAGMGIVDFTNPAACAWFGDKLRALVDMGVDSFKTDFGERIPSENVAYFNGADPLRMHNFYSYLYNEVVFDVLKEKLGEGEAAVFARSGTAGSQKFPVHWGGDCNSNFESMAESLRGGLSLCLSGFGFWSHDIGGFEGTPPAEVYKRWLAFGLLSSHSRLHGSSSYRVPWLFDDEAVEASRFWTHLKCRLMPYLFAKAVEARDSGVPMLRAMMLEFPDDPGCDTLDRQYMLGESLLVAPVFSADNSVDYYLPEGQWTHYLSGKTVSGPSWKRETHDFFSLPLLVRPNTILAVGNVEDKPDYDFADGVTFEVYGLEDGATATTTVPNLNGETALTVTAKRVGNQISVEVEGESSNWQVLLVGLGESGARGLVLAPQNGAKSVSVSL